MPLDGDELNRPEAYMSFALHLRADLAPDEERMRLDAWSSEAPNSLMTFEADTAGGARRSLQAQLKVLDARDGEADALSCLQFYLYTKSVDRREVAVGQASGGAVLTRRRATGTVFFSAIAEAYRETMGRGGAPRPLAVRVELGNHVHENRDRIGEVELHIDVSPASPHNVRAIELLALEPGLTPEDTQAALREVREVQCGYTRRLRDFYDDLPCNDAVGRRVWLPGRIGGPVELCTMSIFFSQAPSAFTADEGANVGRLEIACAMHDTTLPEAAEQARRLLAIEAGPGALRRASDHNWACRLGWILASAVTMASSTSTYALDEVRSKRGLRLESEYYEDPEITRASDCEDDAAHNSRCVHVLQRGLREGTWQSPALRAMCEWLCLYIDLNILCTVTTGAMADITRLQDPEAPVRGLTAHMFTVLCPVQHFEELAARGGADLGEVPHATRRPWAASLPLAFCEGTALVHPEQRPYADASVLRGGLESSDGIMLQTLRNRDAVRSLGAIGRASNPFDAAGMPMMFYQQRDSFRRADRSDSNRMTQFYLKGAIAFVPALLRRGYDVGQFAIMLKGGGFHVRMEDLAYKEPDVMLKAMPPMHEQELRTLRGGVKMGHPSSVARPGTQEAAAAWEAALRAMAAEAMAGAKTGGRGQPARSASDACAVSVFRLGSKTSGRGAKAFFRKLRDLLRGQGDHVNGVDVMVRPYREDESMGMIKLRLRVGGKYGPSYGQYGGCK